ncbi:MAG: hypothetical protein MUO64_07455, partial [Anaerolineales bacterium]|nr:hypothetical protein [Anaerolineales bacterium]
AYFSCEASKVGEINYYLWRGEHPEVTQHLRTYLEQNDELSFEDAPTHVEKTGQLVVLLPPDISLDDPLNPEFEKLREIWQYLTRVGFFVLLVGKSDYTIGLVDGLLYLGANNVSEQDQLLAALGYLDTVVALSHPERLKHTKAERMVPFELSEEATGSEISLALITKIQSTPRKKRILKRLHDIYRIIVPSFIRKKIYLWF